MDYREHAKDLLKRQKSLVSAFSAIKSELDSLENERISVKAAIERAKDSGKDTTGFEDILINLLADLDDCRFRMSIVERELRKIEKGMQMLDEYQRDLIIAFFIEPSQGIADDLMEKWYKERSSLYRDRVIALELFTRSVYGVVQL